MPAARPCPARKVWDGACPRLRSRAARTHPHFRAHKGPAADRRSASTVRGRWNHPANDGNSSRGYTSQFVLGQFDRLAAAERLDGLDAGGFESGQRCLENVLYTAEVLDQPPCSVGPRRGVRAMASHCKARLSLGLGQTARASGTLPPPHHLTRGLLPPRKTMSRSHDTLLC